MESKISKPETQLAMLASMQAKKFMEIFVTIADTQRQSVHSFYRPNSTLLWNGILLKGREQIANGLKKLPGTKHTIETLDAQPIIRPNTFPHTSFVVTCTGTIKYGMKVKKSFHQHFVLERNPDKNTQDTTQYYILTHTFRYKDSKRKFS
mmetsp:Transcript_25390/g.35436  ORF Transcript_25390/g.35436 Transcript_25390/m.35436 type:complete len:150 (-) Transcript_25390:77-526(-)